MAVNASQAPQQDQKQRPCPKFTEEHEPHPWHSHVLQKDVECDGKKRTVAEYHKVTGLGGNYTTATKTDYLTETDANDKPWREDYEAPMTVREARAIAFHMHRNQKDKTGEPYILHLAAVEAGVKVLAGPDATEERIAALFHDAVEDHHTTLKHLGDLGCTQHTLDMIEAVSKRSSEEQNKYLARIIACGPGAMRVKAADLMHNLRHDRIKALMDDPTKKYTAERLLKKYRPALAALLLELSLIVDEDEQKKFATKPQGSASGGTGSTVWSSHTGFDLSVKSLIVGDWPTSYEAPVVEVNHGDGSSVYVLANGEEKVEEWKNPTTKVERKYRVYSHTAWSTSSKIQPHKAATEDMILDYINIVEAAKDSKTKATAQHHTTYADTGQEDLTGYWDDDAGAWSGL